MKVGIFTVVLDLQFGARARYRSDVDSVVQDDRLIEESSVDRRNSSLVIVTGRSCKK